MSNGATAYLYPQTAPQILRRAVDNLVSFRAEVDGSVVTPSTVTYSLFSPSGSAVVDGASATIGADGVATYTVLAASLPTSLSYGEGYREVWAFTFSDGEVQQPTREVYLAKYAPHCPVTQAEVLKRNPKLLQRLRESATSLQGWIDAAWSDVLRELFRRDEWPQQIVSQHSLYDATLARTFAIIYEYLSADGTDRYADMYADKMTAYREAIKGMTFRVDRDEDGTTDNGESANGTGYGDGLQSATKVHYTHAAPMAAYRKWY